MVLFNCFHYGSPTPELVFIGMAIAPSTIPSIARKNGVLRGLSLFRRLAESALLLLFEPLTARGVDPGGGLCTK